MLFRDHSNIMSMPGGGGGGYGQEGKRGKRGKMGKYEMKVTI
jgi:hypothetical protein